MAYHKFLDVAVIPSATEDEVWVIVERVIDGVTVSYLEQMQPRDYGDLEDAWFVDSGISFAGAPIGVLIGLDHLEGETVSVFSGGVFVANRIVTDGEVTLEESVTQAIVGLPYRYKLKPMRFDIGNQFQTTKGSLKRFAELVISFFESSGAKYGVDADNLFDISDWPDTGLYTGDVVVAHEGGFDVEDSVIITGDEPLPCVVRAMIPRIEKTGR